MTHLERTAKASERALVENFGMPRFFAEESVASVIPPVFAAIQHVTAEQAVTVIDEYMVGNFDADALELASRLTAALRAAFPGRPEGI
jgi:hypothetical protein